MKHSPKRGVSLMVVLPLILLLFLLGFFFIDSVLLYTHQSTIHVQSSQLKYAGIAVRELAMLEVVEAGILTSNTKKNKNEIDVKLESAIPNQGQMFFGGNHGIEWFDYRVISRVLLHIPNGTPLKQPYGTPFYVGQDLDGDGTAGSITNKKILQSTCNVNLLPSGDKATFLLFESDCQLGIWNETVGFGVHYD